MLHFLLINNSLNYFNFVNHFVNTRIGWQMNKNSSYKKIRNVICFQNIIQYCQQENSRYHLLCSIYYKADLYEFYFYWACMQIANYMRFPWKLYFEISTCGFVSLISITRYPSKKITFFRRLYFLTMPMFILMNKKMWLWLIQCAKITVMPLDRR